MRPIEDSGDRGSPPGRSRWFYWRSMQSAASNSSQTPCCAGCRHDGRLNGPQDRRCHPGRRLGETGASIVGGRRVSSLGTGPPLPRGSRATAPGSAATAGCRWTTSCCCDRLTGPSRSPAVAPSRSRRPATNKAATPPAQHHLVYSGLILMWLGLSFQLEQVALVTFGVRQVQPDAEGQKNALLINSVKKDRPFRAVC